MSYNFNNIIRQSEPSTEPVTLTEAKNHLRVEHSEDDTLITGLISAARDWVEKYTNRFWASADFKLVYDDFPNDDYPMDLSLPDITAVSSIDYLDDNQAAGSISSGTTLDTDRRQLRYNTTWPETWQSKAVILTVTAGKDAGASPSEVPEAIKSAILLVLADLYEHRAQQTNMQLYKNPAAEMLAHPHRVNLGI